MRNITAFTEATGYKSYPAYISVNEVADGAVAITVRSRDETVTSNLILSKEDYLNTILRPLMEGDKLGEEFCRTTIPHTVCSDLCVTRNDPESAKYRSGTNFMSVMEASAMIKAMLIKFIINNK